VESIAGSVIREKGNVGGVGVDRKGGGGGGERTEIEYEREEKGEHSNKKRSHLPVISVMRER
jgi:hypothetical protein